MPRSSTQTIITDWRLCHSKLFGHEDSSRAPEAPGTSTRRKRAFSIDAKKDDSPTNSGVTKQVTFNTSDYERSFSVLTKFGSRLDEVFESCESTECSPLRQSSSINMDQLSRLTSTKTNEFSNNTKSEVVSVKEQSPTEKTVRVVRFEGIDECDKETKNENEKAPEPENAVKVEEPEELLSWDEIQRRDRMATWERLKSRQKSEQELEKTTPEKSVQEVEKTLPEKPVENQVKFTVEEPEELSWDEIQRRDRLATMERLKSRI